jgi:redox-sensitive bicupin YhaK (pirin superfamily)
MSVRPAVEPLCSSAAAVPTIANVIDARAREVGGIAVRRLLPTAARRMVGPFTFLDEMSQPSFAARPGDRRASAPAYRPGDGHVSV